jgi:DNA-binding MarR family transcriptional regulator
MSANSDSLWAHDVGLAATRFHRSMKNAVDAALEPFGLTGAEYGALLFVDRNPGTSNADLARFLIITPQALGRITARMQNQGVLTRNAEDSVGRRQPLSLTAVGVTALRRAEPHVESAQQALLNPLSPAQQQSFLRALDLCAASTNDPRKDPT